MDIPSFPQDDLIDIMEMTEAIENYIEETLKDSPKSLAFSALMSASINSLLAHCQTIEEVVLYRNIYIKMLDSSIKGIQIKNNDEQ